MAETLQLRTLAAGEGRTTLAIHHEGSGRLVPVALTVSTALELFEAIARGDVILQPSHPSPSTTETQV